ncbi:MAG: hypothetical protein NTZ51_09445 [Proteobacteria bacterium]|nr:hypothetical protein [Pseudomonadota bacterium]
MKKMVGLLCLVVLTGACAGMDYQYQRNMAANAAGYGLAGAAVGAGIAAVTHGNVGKAAAIGTVAGAALGAAFTPPPPPRVASSPQPYYQPPAVYAPPPVVYAPAPVIYAPPPVYGGFWSVPYYMLGGVNFMYYGGGHHHYSHYSHQGYGRRW